MGNRIALGVGVLLMLAGCAMTYRPPANTVQQAGNIQNTATPAVAMQAARRALVLAGYQITAADDASGTISTAPRDLHVTPAQANCGITMGIDYLKDKRTTTRVAMGVIVDALQITVQSNIEGEYKPGAADQNITLTCVSRGLLEADMLAKIQAQLPQK